MTEAKFLRATPTFIKPRPFQVISKMKIANLKVYRFIIGVKVSHSKVLVVHLGRKVHGNQQASSDPY
jgi:hypothetical protein